MSSRQRALVWAWAVAIAWGSLANAAEPTSMSGGDLSTERANVQALEKKPRSSPPAQRPAADAPTIVVLPPQLTVIPPTGVRTLAQHACDRLEEDLARTSRLRVVNRADLNRLIQERRTSPEQSQPALSYDAMLRLAVDADELLPHATLMLVDLSTGNPIDTWTLDWPIADARLAEIVAGLPQRLVKADRAAEPRLKLRLTGVERTQVRMAPLGLRLETLFVDALGQSKGILLVQHLEAASAQEESLLLMMGFSRLAGGRQFAPQADATLELRIAESDEVGKAFEDVPIEVSFRLRHGARPSDEWTSAKGVVRNYDDLARQAWQGLAKQLDKADAGVGAKMLDDLSLRRKQALIEVKAIDSVKPDLPESQLARAKLDHIEAALKLDPLCEQAAFLRVWQLWTFFGHQWTKYSGSREVHELLLAAARYNELFPQNPERNAQVQDYAWDAVRMTPALLNASRGEAITITPDLRVLLDAMKQMVEMSARGDPRRLSRGCPRYLTIVYRGMRQAGVSVEQREAWMDGILAGVREQMTKIEKVASISRHNFVFHHHWIHLIAAQMAAEDDQPKRAKELVSFVRKQMKEPKAPAVDSQRGDLVRIMRGVLIKLDDAAGLAEFDAWVKGSQTPVRASWFGNIPGDGYRVYDLNDHRYKPIEITYMPAKNRPRALSPLCEGKGYMYALTWKDGNDISWSHMRGTSGQGVSQEVVRIGLDEAGRPKGGGAGRESNWEGLEALPQPTVKKYFQALCARFIDGKLYIGTMYSGLLIFDADKKQWKVIDPAAGLPCWSVYSMHPQDDGTLFCTGRLEDNSSSFYFTYAIKSGEVRILRKTDRKAGIYPHELLLDVWKQDGTMRGLGVRAIVPDVMLGDYKKDIQAPNNGTYFFARLGERLFVTSGAGVSELDPSGKVKGRISTGGGSWVLPGFIDHWLLTRQEMPNDTPATGHLVGDGRYLWFTGNCVLYDPESKTWYGPLMSESMAGLSGYSLATSAGLWTGNSQFMSFIDRQKYMEAAVEANRALKTDEYVKLRDAAIAKMPPLPQARTLTAQRKFPQAKAVLDPYLQEHGEEPLAILLTGMINDSWGLKNPAVADDCYSRLEQMTDPSVKFTGMYMKLHVVSRDKKWDQAAATLKRIRDTFPTLEEEYEGDIATLSRQIDKAIAGPAASRRATTGSAGARE